MVFFSSNEVRGRGEGRVDVEYHVEGKLEGGRLGWISPFIVIGMVVIGRSEVMVKYQCTVKQTASVEG